MTDNKTTKFSKKHIIVAAIIVTVILVSIIIGVIIHNNSQKNEAAFDSKQIYNEYTEINEEALDIEEKYATDGFVQPEDISTVLDELEVLAKEYESKGLISSYDKQSTSIYFKLNSGIGYLYTPTVEELLAGDNVGKILTIEPYATSSEFVSNYLIGGKSPDKAAEKIVSKLPDSYSFSKDDNWDSFSFEQVEQMSNHKIIIWYGHGGYVKEYGSVLGTSIPIKDQSSLLLYQLELSNGEMILGKDCFCVSPSYFEKHIEDNSLEGSLVFLGACQSAMDNRLAEVFINKGASLVVGNSQTIRIRYMLYMMDDFMSALTNQYDDGTYWTAEDALAYAKSQNGDSDSEFWAYGAQVKLIYPENKSGYRLYDYDNNSSQTQEMTNSNVNEPKVDNTIGVKQTESTQIESSHTETTQTEPSQSEPTQTNSTSSTIEEKAFYKLYYIVDSGVVGIMGFDDGISNSDISTMSSELQKYGYNVKYIEKSGKNNIIIPKTIGGYPVYAIDGGAFCNCTSIRSITIPNCVEVIEPGAFRGCCSDLIIYGNINSEAQVFANDNNIRFEQQ